MTNNIHNIVLGISNYLIYNNPDGLLKAITDSGIEIPEGANVNNLLMDIYAKSPKKYFEIAKSVPYNSSAENVTTSMNYNKKLKQLTRELKSSISQSASKKTSSINVVKKPVYKLGFFRKLYK